MEIKDLQAHLESATTEIKTLVSAQETEIKAQGESTKATADLLAKATERLDSINADLEEVQKKMARPDFGQPAVKKSLGEMYIDSDEFKSFVGSGARGSSKVVEFKDITGGSASAGGLVPEFRNPNVFMTPDRPLFIRQLVNNTPANGDAVVIMREVDFTNSAAPQSAQLAAKAKSDIEYESITLPVETMAHHFVASRQILSDAPRLASMINQRSVYGLNLNMDSQLLYGDGQGGNLTGLLVDTAINDIGGITVGQDETVAGAMVDHIRKAITACQLNEFYNVNGLVLNPQDWETLELAKGTDGHYIWVTVPNGGAQQMWRVPVIVSNAIQAGDFILGDWTLGSTLYQREGISVRTSESHADLFVKNGVVVLAEERVAFGIELPKAYTKGTFAEAS
jgi:HK97 family phage major capsid protein